MIGWNSLDNTRNCKNEGAFSPAGLASHVQEGDDATVQDRGCAGHFSLLKKKRNTPRPVQNSVLKIDWTWAYLEQGQILAQNNPRPG